MKTRFPGICFIIAITLILASLCFIKASYGQPHREITGPLVAGCFRMPVTPLSYAPPLHSDMPYKTLMGYIYFDSVMRSFKSAAQLDSSLDKIKSFDTLKYFDAILYAMRDYDPILFYEYLMAGDNVNPLYKYSPFSLLSEFAEKTSNISVPLKHKYLASIGIIVHIKIKAITQDSDTLASIPIHPLPLLCFTAQVLDTPKGKHFVSADCGYSKAVNSPCINFSFSPLWNYKGKASLDVGQIVIDSSGNSIYPDSYGNNFLKVDSEYIAFLNPQFLDYDGTYSYYVYNPDRRWGLNGGFLPIDANNQVHDSQNLFGHGTLVNTSTFISNLRQDIDSVLHP